MHAIFIPYGKKEEVDLLIRDMQAQKHQLKCSKEGEKDKFIWIQGQVRILPFGVMEYVFPREDLDLVLHTLDFSNETPYHIPGLYLDMTRKILRAKKTPKYKTDKKYLWVKEHVAIIPIGIREDRDMLGPIGELKDWTHEAI